MATYHGIVKASCLACRYSTISDYTLEAWNDAPMDGHCPSCRAHTGQTMWITADGKVTVLSFVDNDLVATTEVTGEDAWWHLSRAMCERVAALIPNASTADDGGGEYVTIDGLAVELFPVAPENATDPAQARRWHLQINELPQTVCETSDLTVTADPTVVAAWALTLIPPKPEPEVRSPIHTMSDGNALRLVKMLTDAATADRLVRVAWDGGLKVKVGEGMWTPVLSRREQP